MQARVKKLKQELLAAQKIVGVHQDQVKKFEDQVGLNICMVLVKYITRAEGWSPIQQRSQSYYTVLYASFFKTKGSNWR